MATGDGGLSGDGPGTANSLPLVHEYIPCALSSPNTSHGQPRPKSPNFIAVTAEKNSPEHPGALYPRGGKRKPFPHPP
jgi:hypothetical protein